MLTDYSLKRFLDQIEDGIIIVDRDKVIRVYNRRAREIFGIGRDSGPGHPAGSLETGDIVILADTCLGADDGGLEPQDLSIIGIPAHAIGLGDAFVAVGCCRDFQEPPYFKVATGGHLLTPLSLSCYVSKKEKVSAVIDDFIKKISITINDNVYDLAYQVTIAHLVILDGKTGTVKFYQSRGYTARGEDAGYILKGKPFTARGPGSPSLHIIGQPIGSIHPDNLGTHYLNLILGGGSSSVEGKEYPVNGIWVRSSAFPLFDEGNKVIGGALIFRDISELKTIERQTQNKGFKYPAFQKIVGHSPDLMEAIRVAQRTSKSASTVLLLGESGTGKGLFARAIHENSNRAGNPFIVVNMAAIPGHLLESELFGYAEGAFTGARKGGELGKFRLAQGGTLFLDEIGEMDFCLQAKLLNVLQEDSFYPLGSSKIVKTDVRVIAATNRDLEEEVKKGNFREDLFYRLNVVSISLPPLRQCKADIPELIHYVLPKIEQKVGKGRITVAPEVYDDFAAYYWPGNIRELENVLERAVNLAEGDVLTSTVLPSCIQRVNRAHDKTENHQVVRRGGVDLKNHVASAEKEAIIQALEACRYNKTAAIQLLGIGRTAFYQKIKGYRIPLKEGVRNHEQ